MFMKWWRLSIHLIKDWRVELNRERRWKRERKWERGLWRMVMIDCSSY